MDIFGYHYSDTLEVARAATVLQNAGLPTMPFWSTEQYGRSINADRLGKEMMPVWFRNRAAGTVRMLHFIYHLPIDLQSTPGFAEFGEYLVNLDYTLKPLAVAVRTLADEVGSAAFMRTFQIRDNGKLNGYIFDRAGTQVIAIVREVVHASDSPVGAWGSTPGLKVRVKVPQGTSSVLAIDLMGNQWTIPVASNRVDIPLDGNPVFIEGVATTSPKPLEYVRFVP